MDIGLRIIKVAVRWVWALLSVYMIYNGCVLFMSTSGYVQGSEFGMLITLVNQVSLIMIWLALSALHLLLEKFGSKRVV